MIRAWTVVLLLADLAVPAHPGLPAGFENGGAVDGLPETREAIRRFYQRRAPPALSGIEAPVFREESGPEASSALVQGRLNERVRSLEAEGFVVLMAEVTPERRGGLQLGRFLYVVEYLPPAKILRRSAHAGTRFSRVERIDKPDAGRLAERIGILVERLRSAGYEVLDQNFWGDDVAVYGEVGFKVP